MNKNQLFFATLVIVLAANVASAEDKRKCVAFVVGIEKYREAEFNQLSYVGEDAFCIWKELISITDLDTARSALLIADRDAKGELPERSTKSIAEGGSGLFEKVERNELRDRFESFLRQINDGDLVVVFLGGHGQVPEDVPSAGVHYLPTNFKRENGKFANCIKVSDLLEGISDAVSTLPNADVVCFANMCHAGDVVIPSALTAAQVSGDSTRRRFAYFPACSGSAEASESDSAGGSYFAQAMRRGLQGEGRDKTSTVTTAALFEYVRDELRSNRVPKGHRQDVQEIPGFAGNIRIGRVVLMESQVRRLWIHSLISVALDQEISQRNTILRLAQEHLRFQKELEGEGLDLLLTRMQIEKLLNHNSPIDVRALLNAAQNVVKSPDGKPAATINCAQKLIANFPPADIPPPRLVFVIECISEAATTVDFDIVANQWLRLFRGEKSTVLKQQYSASLDWWDEVVNTIEEATRMLDGEMIVICTGYLTGENRRGISDKQVKHLMDAMGKRAVLIWDAGFGDQFINLAKQWTNERDDRGVLIVTPVNNHKYYFIYSEKDREQMDSEFPLVLMRNGFSNDAYVKYFKYMKQSVPGTLEMPIWIGDRSENTMIRRDPLTVIGPYGLPNPGWAVHYALNGGDFPGINAVLDRQDPFELISTATQLEISNKRTEASKVYAQVVESLGKVGDGASDPFSRQFSVRIREFREQLKSRSADIRSNGKVHFVPICGQIFESPLLGRLRGTQGDLKRWSTSLEKVVGADAFRAFPLERSSGANVEKALIEAAEGLTDNDTLLVVYSGRGWQSPDGQRYIALEDSAVVGDDSPHAAGGDASPLPVNKLAQLVQTGKGCRIVVLDCQFTDPRIDDPPGPSVFYKSFLYDTRPPINTRLGVLGSQIPFPPRTVYHRAPEMFGEGGKRVGGEEKRRPTVVRGQTLARGVYVWWNGPLREMNLSGPQNSPDSKFGSYISMALTAALSGGNQNALFSGTIEEWVTEAAATDPGGRLFKGTNRDSGFVIQGAIDNRLFSSERVELPLRYLESDFPRRILNLDAAITIFDVHNPLLNRSIDRLTRAALEITKSSLQQSMGIAAPAETISGLLQELRSLIPNGPGKLEVPCDLLMLTLGELLYQSGKPAEAVKEIARLTKFLPQNSKLPGEVQTKIIEYVHRAAATDSDELLNELEHTLTGDLQTPAQDLRNSIRSSIRRRNLDLVPISDEAVPFPVPNFSVPQ